ncbi:hypothetical protein Bpfe_014290, partial [Biomphalaria pfeifferi]
MEKSPLSNRQDFGANYQEQCNHVADHIRLLFHTAYIIYLEQSNYRSYLST